MKRATGFQYQVLIRPEATAHHNELSPNGVLRELCNKDTKTKHTLIKRFLFQSITNPRRALFRAWFLIKIFEVVHIRKKTYCSYSKHSLQLSDKRIVRFQRIVNFIVFQQSWSIFVDELSLAINNPETSVDRSWHAPSVLDDELSFEKIQYDKISCRECKIAKISARSMHIKQYKQMVESANTSFW